VWAGFLTEEEFDVRESSISSLVSLRTRASGDRQPTLSRLYRSPSPESEASVDTRTCGDPSIREDRSRAPVRRTFFLENSSSGDEESASEEEAGISVDGDAGKVPRSASREFRDLVMTLFRRDGAACVPDDRPHHHGSLGNFVLPSGSFGGAVLPHVSSFG